MTDSLPHQTPRECPVCAGELAITHLGCRSCGTEIVGLFEFCAFCALDDKDLALLQVFLTSRGNLREVEKYLGVSYPTARARYAQLLVKLGLTPEAEQPGMTREQILSEVAAGALTPEEAAPLLQVLLDGVSE